MPDSRKPLFIWGTGIAIVLATYVASPPFLMVIFAGGEPGPPFDAIINAVYWPLGKPYEVSPWYVQYINLTHQMLLR
jgi:hypothetical protein